MFWKHLDTAFKKQSYKTARDTKATRTSITEH